MNIIKWLGAGGILVTAYLTSINIYPLNIMMGVISTILLVYVSVKDNDRPYLMLNMAILLMNASALWRIYS